MKEQVIMRARKQGVTAELNDALAEREAVIRAKNRRERTGWRTTEIFPLAPKRHRMQLLHHRKEERVP